MKDKRCIVNDILKEINNNDPLDKFIEEIKYEKMNFLIDEMNNEWEIIKINGDKEMSKCKHYKIEWQHNDGDVHNYLCLDCGEKRLFVHAELDDSISKNSLIILIITIVSILITLGIFMR